MGCRSGLPLPRHVQGWGFASRYQLTVDITGAPDSSNTGIHFSICTLPTTFSGVPNATQMSSNHPKSITNPKLTRFRIKPRRDIAIHAALIIIYNWSCLFDAHTLTPTLTRAFPMYKYPSAHAYIGYGNDIRFLLLLSWFANNA